MKLPAEVKVGPKTYRLLWSGAKLPSTLIHELIHAVADVYGVEIDESSTTALANGLAQALISLKVLPEDLDI